MNRWCHSCVAVTAASPISMLVFFNVRRPRRIRDQPGDATGRFDIADQHAETPLPALEVVPAPETTALTSAQCA